MPRTIAQHSIQLSSYMLRRQPRRARSLLALLHLPAAHLVLARFARETLTLLPHVGGFTVGSRTAAVAAGSLIVMAAGAHRALELREELLVVLPEHLLPVPEVAHDLLLLAPDGLRQLLLLPRLLGDQPLVLVRDAPNVLDQLCLHLHFALQGLPQASQLVEVLLDGLDCLALADLLCYGDLVIRGYLLGRPLLFLSLIEHQLVFVLK